jgi:hypothetical protein
LPLVKIYIQKEKYKIKKVGEQNGEKKQVNQQINATNDNYLRQAYQN